jgi:DNA-binding NtrC family response regulator
MNHYLSPSWKPSLLIIEDDLSLRGKLNRSLAKEFLIFFTETSGKARKTLDSYSIDIAMIDIDLGEAENGLALLREIKKQDPHIVCMMTTADKMLATVNESINLGAALYLKKPYALEELRLQLEICKIQRAKVLEMDREIERVKRATDLATHELIGGEAFLSEIKNHLEKLSTFRETSVLISGETGSGKEVVARAIHRACADAKRPFIPVNLSAIPHDLIESELFGHEAGSFTGATQKRIGCFELADGGDLFLDEVSEMPLSLQPKLLRVLQEKQFSRVGGSQLLRSNFRLICATNRDLQAMIREGTFRKDLYYRIYVVQIKLPPLSERKKDIGVLANYFISELNIKYKKGIVGLEKNLLTTFENMRWEGNVRALKNIIENLYISATSDVIRSSDFSWGYSEAIARPTASKDPEVPAPDAFDSLPQSLNESAKQAEKSRILVSLARHGWRKGEVCEELGISSATLKRRLHQFDIEKPIRANRVKESPHFGSS